MKRNQWWIWIIVFLLTASQTPSVIAHMAVSPSQPTRVNLAHLNHLQDEVTINGIQMAITRVYSEYPDYGWVPAKGEGIGCVDDTARAAIVYLRDFELNRNRDSLERARKALNFIRYMQADDGEFYNFVFADYSINRDGPTSYKSMGWWAARAMWALGYGYRVFSKEDPAYAAVLKKHFLLANEALQRTIAPQYGQYRTIHGVKVPAWMDAFDAMSNALLGLTEFYRTEPLPEVKKSMEMIGNGLQQYQLGDFGRYPYHAHLDWGGSIQLWHAWGSSQPMALAQAGMVLKRKDWIVSAREAADGLYAHLLTSGMIKEMAPTPTQFEQIAYGVNRMVQGLISVYQATGNPEYARMAGLAASWFTGNNAAHTAMYDPATGRGYDGIIAPDKINRNAGAESTIETLMAMQSVLSNRWAAPYLNARTVEMHGLRVMEAEKAQVAQGSPVIVTPDSSWNGEATYSGQIVKMSNRDGLTFVLNSDRLEPVQIEAALEKQATSKGQSVLEVWVNGKPIALYDAGGSPDRDYLWREPIGQAVLKKGVNRITVIYHGVRPLILDNIVVQPVHSFVSFTTERTGLITFIHDIRKKKNWFVQEK